MKTVYRYELDSVISEIVMYKYARILTCESQGGNIFIWAEVVTTNDLEKRTFIAVPTGGRVGENMKYVDTVFLDRASLVFHIYEGNRG